ncbi:MAG TPA: SpoIIE family protein phosphatase [Spirochaetia bacterium]|nr:SpoIIE family protein phosphatase [Spirochaetia bacterium]
MPQSREQREQYRRQLADSLTRINRVFAFVGLAITAYLLLFSDASSYPQYAQAMFVGRMYTIVGTTIVGLLSFFPFARRIGIPLSFLLFVSGTLQMAHLTAVMNNIPASLTAWVYINLIFCGIYPLPVTYSFVAVVIGVAYYIFAYRLSGFVPDVAFQQTLVNIIVPSLLALAFKVGMDRIRRREFYFRVGLEKANKEIADLNTRLEDENLRLSHELEVAQHIQNIVLPQESDYQAFRDLQISCRMIPATEVGGDFYDTIHFGPEGFISIGDVTDHGLHSGLIMMMVHTALRALSRIERNDIQRIYGVINKLLYDFRLKTLDHRIMSLVILKYMGEGNFMMTGQHETLLMLRKDGTVQNIESLEYGMYAGLDSNVLPYLKLHTFHMEVGDVLVLYTDGVTEAMNDKSEVFGTEGIIRVAEPLREASADAIQTAIVEACQQHIGQARRFDDISVVVVKKVEDKGWDGQMRGTVEVGDRIDFEKEVESAFNVRFLPLDMFDNWQRGSVLSDFTADYFRHNFPSDEQTGLISTVVNELVENAVKFSSNNSLPVDLTLKKARGRLLVQISNTVPQNRCQPFMAICRELFAANLDDLYVKRMDEGRKDKESSGLGLLLIKKDYTSKLGFQFRFDDDDTVRVTVTTELAFP